MLCCIADSVQNIQLLLNVLQDDAINLKLVLNANEQFMFPRSSY